MVKYTMTWDLIKILHSEHKCKALEGMYIYKERDKAMNEAGTVRKMHGNILNDLNYVCLRENVIVGARMPSPLSHVQSQ